ncbi:TVP38/TMEM64 family protein [Rariglobus hedericola]|nr:hypothetical protein [Rariglobus hedericola]
MKMRAFKFNLSKRQWLIGGTVLLALVGAALWLFLIDFDWLAIPRAMEKLNTGVILTLTSILPLVGFPISMVYLLIGARFGPLIGLGIVSAITAFHLIGTHWIARSFLRGPLERFIKRRYQHMPEVPPGENAAVALMVMLAPGIPYFIRNYVLGLSGIPLRIYFWIALPIHVLRSYVALFLGDFGGAPSTRGLILLGAIYGTKIAIFSWVAWRLRLRHKRLALTRTAVTQDAPG